MFVQFPVWGYYEENYYKHPVPVFWWTYAFTLLGFLSKSGIAGLKAKYI